MENHFKAIECLVQLHELIKQGNTGSPDVLTHKLGVSRGQLYKMIAILNDFGADIQYSRIDHSFSYHNSFKIQIIRASILSN